MKSKLRKIVVEEEVYYYRITDNFQMETFPSFIRIKIFSEGCKTTPLLIEFPSKYDLYAGFPLKNGVDLPNLLNNITECVNIHQPKYIQKFILLGKKYGWKGNNVIPIQNGMDYLSELGYDVSSICGNKICK
ncbi:hypothetical protein [Capnocytophaga stomatis]|uniref:Uncharacterized protein n=1 Tax=Capnocytophaga stomatis TaxID=1848904 RepID=A0A250FVN0_9FLAO|nr:hypothetical protein [Capnocytophaga stomatis]ATA89170.1 hypothetical protein CGC58_05205 [Capnocytophaga stomatis]GIJ93998.1 hypothetical protein CAPN002_12160 [Capnocytophaga stomatis]